MRSLALLCLLACRSHESPPPPPVEPPVVAPPKQPSTAQERLEAALRSNMLHDQVWAVGLLARARIPKTAPLLYIALDGSPNIRVLAAHALVDMRQHDAIPKLREVLAKSKERDLELEVGMALYRLGAKDPDIRAIVNSGSLRNHPTWRLEAALALADADDELARAPLSDIAARTPKDGDQYWRAIGGLAQLGDQASVRILEAELGKRPASRVLRAAKLLAHAGNAKGLDRLAALLADKEYENPEEAALALAMERDRRALTWVSEGLQSPTAEERLQAVTIASWFSAAEHKAMISKLATTDPDQEVRLSAELAQSAF